MKISKDLGWLLGIFTLLLVSGWFSGAFVFYLAYNTVVAIKLSINEH
jgi:hypothetical protein